MQKLNGIIFTDSTANKVHTSNSRLNSAGPLPAVLIKTERKAWESGFGRQPGCIANVTSTQKLSSSYLFNSALHHELHCFNIKRKKFHNSGS